MFAWTIVTVTYLHVPTCMQLTLPPPSIPAFASVCHQSTDFHFPDIDVQLSRTQEHALSANREREERKPRHAQNSHSDSQSNLELSENGDAQSGSSSSQVPTPDCVATPTSGGGGVAVGVGSSPLLETTSVSLEPGKSCDSVM